MFFKRFKRKRIRIKSIKKDIAHEVNKLIKDLKQQTKCNLAERTKAEYDLLLLFGKINRLIAEFLLETENEKIAYRMTSLFLHKNFNLLNKNEKESVHFVTGPEFGNTKYLSDRVSFRLAHQEIDFAKGYTDAVRKVLLGMQEHDYKLWSYFHIHPGSGTNSISPSVVDLRLDELLIRGGYKVVGVIFSRDGFIRFFSSRPFKIEIYGKGVEKINDELFRLVEINKILYEKN